MADLGSLGTLFVNLTANSAALVTGMNQAVRVVQQSSNAMNSALAATGAAAAATAAAFVMKEIESFVADTLKAVLALQQLSTETGITINFLGELKYMADKQNIGSTMEQGIRRFARAMEEAQVEGSRMQLLFKQMGVDPFGSLEDGFRKVADDFKGYEDGVRKITLAQALFGMRNEKFIRLLQDGSEGLSEEAKKFHELFGVDMEQAGKMAEQWNSTMVDFQTVLKGVALIFASEFLPSLINMIKSGESHIAVLRQGAEILGGAFSFALKGVVMIYEGWQGLLQTVSLFALKSASAITGAIKGATDEILLIVKLATQVVEDFVNLAISAVNKMRALLPNALGGGGQFGKVKLDFDANSSEVKSTLNEWQKIFDDAAKEIDQNLQKEFNGIPKTIEAAAPKVAEATKKALAPLIDEAQKTATEIKKYLSPDGFIKQLIQVNRETAHIAGIPGFSDFTRLEDDKLNNQRQLDVLRKFGDEKYHLTDEQEKRRQALIKKYEDQEVQMTLAQNKLIIGTLGKMSEDMLTIASAFGSKQSGIYQAMFAASKAFAIAESTVKIMQGVASAASLPWPANLAAMAQVVAATANIVSTIQAVKLEFGGQKALGGNVTANTSFLVGEDGPEIFVPPMNGNIIPNSRLGGNTNVVVHNYTDAQPVVTERKEGDDRVIEIMMKKVKTSIASDVHRGKGDISKAFERTFGLRRGLTQA
jgi:hypothetical protein